MTRQVATNLYLQKKHLTSWNTPDSVEIAPGEASIFRWAGSKKKLIKQLKLMSPTSFTRYFEPFVGSGTVLLGIKPNEGLISDINSCLINAYLEIQNRPSEIWESLMSLNSSEDEYYRIRKIQPEDLSPFDQAVRFVYLNRYCFNGVYRTNQQGKFNVSRGQGNLGIPNLEAFLEFSYRLRGLEIKNVDYEEVIDLTRSGDFLYLDPPYLDANKRDRGEYGASVFSEPDLTRLCKSAQRASQRGVKILFSYRDCETVRGYFPDWKIISQKVQRNISCSTSNRQKAVEIILFNY